jgi:hypothetical protein
MPCRIRPERAAPRKRSMVAWRRRPIPRVMQYPRQEYVLAAAKKVQHSRGNTDDETKLIPPPYLFRRWGGPPDCSPPWAAPRAWPHAAGPFSRTLVERDADPFLLAPGDAAQPLQLFGWHIKCEAVGDEQRRHDFERGPGFRDVSNGAVDSPAAELDGSSLQSAAPRGDPGLFHDVVIGDSRPDASRLLQFL